MKFIIATFFMLFSVLAQAQISIHDAGRAGAKTENSMKNVAMMNFILIPQEEKIARNGTSNATCLLENFRIKRLSRTSGDTIGCIKGLMIGHKEAILQLEVRHISVPPGHANTNTRIDFDGGIIHSLDHFESPWLFG
jgi:hypothetical protein